MVLPLVLQNIIISFIPSSNMRLVCKKWNSEVSGLHKKYLNKIGGWYKKKNCR